MGHAELAESKQDLHSKLNDLRGELDALLAKEYGVDTNEAATFQQWEDSHQPFHWFVEFHGIMGQGGFDVVVGNPPYVPRGKVAESYAIKGFQTAGCPDIYAAIVERSVSICQDNGRISMIVPLSLGFSSDLAKLRALLYQSCGNSWFSSFGRIPSALFSFDTRVRNTIYLGHKSAKSPPSCFTTRLHRWFDAERPTLFHNLGYSSFSPAAFDGLVPKIGSTRLLRGFESLLEGGDYRLKNELSERGKPGEPFHFKQNAYNWLTFCVAQPPVYGKDGDLLAQTKYGTVRFRTQDARDLSLTLANGKLMFLWWVGIGDDFDLTQNGFASAPFGPGQLTEHQRNGLLASLPELEKAMNDKLVFKLNAGKNIGNFNLARCRHITDQTDRVWLEASGLSDLWEEIELEYSLIVRTEYDEE